MAGIIGVFDVLALSLNDFGVPTGSNEKPFDPSTSIKDNTITIDNPTGFETKPEDFSFTSFSIFGSTFELGQAVKYDTDGGTAIGGLVNGKTYYVVASTNENTLSGDSRLVGEQKILLAETEAKSRAGVAIVLDPSMATGTNHSLTALNVLDSGLTTGLGVVATLDSSDSASAESGLESQEFDPRPDTSKKGKVKDKINTSLGDRLFQKITEAVSGNDAVDNARKNTGSSSKLSMAGALSFVITDHSVLAIAGDIVDNGGQNFDTAFDTIEDQSGCSACGLRPSGDVECWGAAPALRTFAGDQKR